MQNLYTLIHDCLQVLRQCDIAAIPKLRLEVQLFQIKLLLMRDEVSRGIKVKYCSEAVLQEIHDQLAGFRDGEAGYVTIEAVGRRLQKIGFDLAEATSAANNRPGSRL